MTKKTMVILAEGFEEIEAITVIDVLRRAEIEVTIAGLTDIKISGSHGISINADKMLCEAGIDFDACILPGGMPGATNLASSKDVKELIQKMVSSGKLIAAICASPAIVLAPTGILYNKSATCYPGMQGHFGQDTIYKEDDVVIDGNIITSRGPATALSFALAIVKKLIGKEIQEKIGQAMLAI